MKTKMIVKCNDFISPIEKCYVTKHLLNEWNNSGVLFSNSDIEIKAVILENEKGEITVINLEDKKVKTRKNILKKIKKLFKRKNKVQNLDI